MTPEAREILCDLLLAVADDKLLLGHRNSDWTGLGPILEEDIAFSSIAQDEIAHAQALYELVASMTESTADQIAFGRPPHAYRCAALLEGSDEGDWATALARQLFCDHFDALRLARLARSSHTPLAELAARLVREEQVHVNHADEWVTRLGQGGEEARERLQRSLDELAPLATGLFEPVKGEEQLVELGLYPVAESETFATYRATLRDLLKRAGLTLDLPEPSSEQHGGRRGVHTAALTALLDEMCEVFRLEPNAAW